MPEQGMFRRSRKTWDEKQRLAVVSLTDPETPDHFKRALAVGKPQILQEARTPGNHHQQAATACMVLLVRFKMRREVVNPSCQKCNLHLRRTRVGLSATERPNQLLFLHFGNRHRHAPQTSAVSVINKAELLVIPLVEITTLNLGT